MKKIILLLIILLTGVGLTAQHTKINHLFSTYRGEEEVIALYIPGFLCRLAATFGDLSGEERELLNSIKSIRILVSENPDLNSRVNFAKEINSGKLNKNYRILLSVHEADEDVLILGYNKKDYIQDLIIVVGGDENVLVYIKGRIGYDLIDSLYEVSGIEQCRYTKEI